MKHKQDDFFEKGTEYYEKGEFKKALRLLLKAQKMGYKDYFSHLNIGNVYDDYAFYQGEKNRKKAKKWFKKGMALGDNSCMVNLAVSYQQENKMKKAKKWFKKVVKLGDNETGLLLAQIYLQEGKIQKAIKLLEVFKGDRLLLNMSEGGQEDGLKLLEKIRENIIS